MTSLRVVVYTNVNWEHALAVLRYRAPAQALGWDVIRGNDAENAHPDRVSQADIVLIQRGFPYNFEAFSEVLRLAREQKKPIIYEVDDWILGMPEDHPAYDAHIEQLIPVLLGVAEADVVFVSSQELQVRLDAFHPRVWLCPNGLPDEMWSVRPLQQSDPDVPVVIGYMGTATHLPDLDAVAPALLRVLDARPKAVLRVWGCPLPSTLQEHPRVKQMALETADYREFAAFFNTQKVDLWIAPLLDTDFNRAKSPIKFWEYASTGAPGIFQDMPPYRNVVQDEENGLLAGGLEDWYQACLRLIDTPAERKRLAAGAQQTLRERGLLSAVLSVWESNFRRSLEFAGQGAGKMTRLQEILRPVLHRVQRRAWQRHLDTIALLEQLQTHQHNLSELQQQRVSLQQELNAVLNSRSWRLMRRVQRVRGFLVPSGGRREQAIKFVFRGLRAWRRDGTRFTLRRIWSGVHTAISRRYFRWQQQRYGDVIFSVQAVGTVPSLSVHTASVDIIVCVHNALDDVRRCLESVVRYTMPPYTLILVDDGSDDPTKNYLRRFAETQGAVLLRNEQAHGYTLAANQGLRASTADYALLLNSDTIVTPYWLDSMVACAESDDRIGLVGPLSNTASWQSVPETLNEQGDWADNALPEGVSITEMATRVRKVSERLYPRIPFLNGFCLMIRRAVLEEIGYFDEETFGAGYGEENDYCLRVRKAGWSLAVADDAYIYHAQSKSYSHERRRMLARRADEKLAAKHGQPIISQGVQRCKEDPTLIGIRARTHMVHQRVDWIQQGIKRWEGRRILFVLPVLHATGGGHVIVQEARAMRQMGVDVHLLNLRPHKSTFQREYPECDLPVIYVDEPRLPTSLYGSYDAFVATVYHTVKWLDPVTQAVRGYYIQDFEPWFFQPDTPEYHEAWHSYTHFNDIVRITKTDWNRQTLLENLGVDAHVVGPSLDIDLFRPRPPQEPHWPDLPLRIAAMVRPSTPRRQPQFTIEVLREFKKRHKNDVEIVFFGCDPGDPDFQRQAQGFLWRHAGVLTRQQLARLFSETDIFLDASAFQAMGLTAMEAMACGTAVIVPQGGGASSFAVHERNALFVDTRSQEAVLHALERLASDHALRKRLQAHAITDICAHTPEQAAYRFLEALFGGKH